MSTAKEELTLSNLFNLHTRASVLEARLVASLYELGKLQDDIMNILNGANCLFEPVDLSEKYPEIYRALFKELKTKDIILADEDRPVVEQQTTTGREN